MPEPGEDNCADDPLTPGEWAAWALLDDPYARVSETLAPLASRISLAVREAIREDRDAR